MPSRSRVVATLWRSDPDKTMHAFPLGSGEHLQAVREAEVKTREAEQILNDILQKLTVPI